MNPIFLLFSLKGLLAGIYIKFYNSLPILIGTSVISVSATYMVMKSHINPSTGHSFNPWKKSPPAFLNEPLR